MKKIIQSIALTFFMFGAYVSNAQVVSGGTTSTKCQVSCPFSSCSATCTGTTGAAICTCAYGFATCGCGGTSSKSTISNQHKANLDLLVHHLNSFNSVTSINLRIKVGELITLSDNPEANFNPLIDEILELCYSLNAYEKSSYNNFVQTLMP
ncbi:MAG: hypothetical protein H6605_07595 [Flavobacteriales bacterium]|nr:hypothetical protein [Flavobacteriales bacterium]